MLLPDLSSLKILAHKAIDWIEFGVPDEFSDESMEERIAIVIKDLGKIGFSVQPSNGAN